MEYLVRGDLKMAYEDIYKGLTEEERKRMIKADIPKFVRTGIKIERTEEKKKADDKNFERLLRADGLLKSNEHIVNGQIVQDK